MYLVVIHNKTISYQETYQFNYLLLTKTSGLTFVIRKLCTFLLILIYFFALSVKTDEMKSSIFSFWCGILVHSVLKSEVFLCFSFWFSRCISSRLIFLSTEKRYISGNTCISSKGVGNYLCGNSAVKINLLINHVNVLREKMLNNIKLYSSYIKR